MTAPGERTTLLVFGADRTRRLSAARALEAAGYRARMASSMAEAAKVIAAGDVSLVVYSEMPEAGASVVLTQQFGLSSITSANGNDSLLAGLVRAKLQSHEPGEIAQDGESE